MRLGIHHLTRYDYSHSVDLGLHKVFLHPQPQSFQRIERAELKVTPAPEGQNSRLDLAGNSFYTLWFSSPTQTLEILSELRLECNPFNPFDFIIDSEFLNTAQADGIYSYTSEYELLVKAFVPRDTSADMQSFVLDIFGRSPDPLSALVNLTAQIKDKWTHLIREEENLWTPAHTFQSAKGSCRDLAWMQMNMLGIMGLASRFVSGYAYNPEQAGGHELHAWLEVFLPGAGWVGMDPSLGLLTDHHYVPLAFHPEPQHTLPVQGKFGGKATASLSTMVKIWAIDSP